MAQSPEMLREIMWEKKAYPRAIEISWFMKPGGVTTKHIREIMNDLQIYDFKARRTYLNGNTHRVAYVYMFKDTMTRDDVAEKLGDLRFYEWLRVKDFVDGK